MLLAGQGSAPHLSSSRSAGAPMILSRSTLAAPRSTPSPQAHAVLRAATATASPRTSERVVAEGQDIAVLNGNPAGSVSLYRQLTSDEDDERDSGAREQPWLPSQGWRRLPHHLQADELWSKIRNEARRDAEQEGALASFLHSSILAHSSLNRSLAVLLANKLSSQTLPSTQLMRLITEAQEDDPEIMESAIADLQAVYERDPACERYTTCLLYYKGYQALQCHRVAHWLWKKGRKSLATLLQSRVSETMQVDVHPGAQIGRGVLIDHATGVVIGETAVVGDNVSMLHHVTLGGSGTGTGTRHPHVDHGVLLGAGVCVLGPVLVGAGSKVGAGSVVVTDLPCHCVAVGVPARIIRQNCPREPSMDMDHVQDFVFDYVI